MELRPVPDGNIWFTDFDTGDIGRFNPSTKQVSLFPLPTPNHLYEISGICSGPGDMMWFVGIDGVASITLNGTITEYGLPGSGFGSDYPVPYTSIVVGPDGNLWTQLGNIFEISPQGNYTEMTAPATPNDMTIGSDGNLWFTDCVRNIVGRIAITPIMPDQITISPSPIAPKGSLTPGQTVNVVIKATSNTEGLVGEVPLLVAFNGASGGGSASVGPTSLGPVAQLLTTDTSGEIDVTYSTRSILPFGGTDTLTIQTETGTITENDAYIYSLSDDATLSGLSISSGLLSPGFTSGTTSYSESVTNDVSSVTVTSTVNQANATMTVNGMAVASGSPSQTINLAVGSNMITVVVTAQDGSTQDSYIINITRVVSNDASLENLTFSSGDLLPSITSGSLVYIDNVGSSVTSVTATPTANQVDATIKVDGAAVTNGGPSQSINLVFGNNSIVIVVTAPDGLTTQTYTIIITRAAAAMVSSQTPTAGSNGVSVSVHPTVVFSTAMDSSSVITSTVKLIQGSTPIVSSWLKWGRPDGHHYAVRIPEQQHDLLDIGDHRGNRRECSFGELPMGHPRPASLRR